MQSLQNFDVGSVSLSSFNIGGEPFAITYKVVVNGAVIDEQSVEVEDGADPFYKDYQL